MVVSGASLSITAPVQPTSVDLVDPVLLSMQAPLGVPKSSVLATTTDPLIPPRRVSDMLAHFFDEVYDLSPQSHLSRLLKVLLGDSGAGRIRKRYLSQHLSQVLMTTHYYDLDQLYATVFGLHRLVRESLGANPYYRRANAQEWEEIEARDASYRSRVEQFSHAISWGGTPTGMAVAAQSILGIECRVYETYSAIDSGTSYSTDVSSSVNTYADVAALGTYGGLESYTYARLEGRTIFVGRLASRAEFVVRPLRAITDEESYELVRVLSRLKPAGTLLTVDPRGVEIHSPLSIRRVSADSSYWHVKTQVAAREEQAHLYERVESGQAVEQPRPAFSYYQGEAWSYNADVSSVAAYVEDADETVVSPLNQGQRQSLGQVVNYSPDKALSTPQRLLAGRAVSDGVMVAPVVERVGVSA